MAENLNYETGNSWCYGDATEDFICRTWGRLYDWETARTACPAGWHLPTREDWNTLEETVGNDGTKLKKTSGWTNDGNGTDDYGFSALPSGYRSAKEGYVLIGKGGAWWSDSKDGTNSAVVRAVSYKNGGLEALASDLGDGASVRCVEGPPGESDNLTGTGDGQSAGGTGESGESDKLTDKRDEKTYKTVKIGKQTWMAQNLNYKTASGSWCYNNDESKCKQYGRLYDWNTAMSACPSGWHLPSSEEWDALEAVAGGSVAGKKLKSKTGWNKNGNGTDEYGFSALPGGVGSDDDFSSVGESGYWWTATGGYGEGNSDAENRGMFFHDGVEVDEGGSSVSSGYSVRCVMD
jgi:uncharacterized protein (TIGR02145 family)